MVAAPAPPKAAKPASGYALFLDSARAAISKEIGSSSVLAISAAAYGKWKELDDKKKAEFEEKAKKINAQQAAQQEALGEQPAAKQATANAAPAPVAGAKKPDSDDETPLAVAAKKAQSLSAVASEKRKASSLQDEPAEKKAKKEKKQEKKEKKEDKKENKAAKKAPAKNAKNDDEYKNFQASPKFRAQVDEAVKAYMKKEKEWRISQMQEELSEEHTWESDQWLKMAIRTSLNNLGFTGNSAAVPQKVAAWY